MKRLISVLISTTMAFVVFGCSVGTAKDLSLNSEDVSETTGEKTDVTESEETVTETSASETTEEETENPPVIDISSDGYYTDYPLFLEDRTIYVRRVPGFDFYADVMDPLLNKTYYDQYIENNKNGFLLFSGPDAANRGFDSFDPYVSFDLNNRFGINWHVENAETGLESIDNDSFEIGEPEVCENGITIYEIKWHCTYEYEAVTETIYLLEYRIDDDNLMVISLQNFLANEWIDTDPIINTGDMSLYSGPSGYEEGLNGVLDYFRTAEDPFLIVDKDAIVNFVE